jgi:hypothetical protein
MVGHTFHILYTKRASDKLPEARAPSVTDSRKGYEDDVIWLVATKRKLSLFFGACKRLILSSPGLPPCTASPQGSEFRQKVCTHTLSIPINEHEVAQKESS